MTPEHEHTGLEPGDNDICTSCEEIVCEGCGAVLDYEQMDDTYLHPYPLCDLHAGMGTRPMTPERQLAGLFTRVLRQWLEEEELEQVRLRNKAQIWPSVCHSHDFCDANMAMVEAYHRAGLPSPSPDDEAGMAIWTRAWDLAKATDFRL